MASTDPTPAATMTRPQQERRRRILDATRSLATKGGYDGVQMRDVAEQADVALGTLYRYFPSKTHLLVGLMQDATANVVERSERHPPKRDKAAERVIETLTSTIRGLQREPKLTGAMVRAVMTADTSAAHEVDEVTDLTSRMILHSMHAGDDRAPTEDDEAIARVIEQVWLSSMTKWLSGRASAAQLVEDIEIATRLLLR